MGKKHGEKLKENFTKNYLPQFKKFFQDWDVKVMSYVMMVVIMIAMIAATVAWFTHMMSVRASELGFTTGSSDSLKVEVKQSKNTAAEGNEYFVEVKEGEEDTVLVDLEMPVFDNVEIYTVSGNGIQDASDEGASQIVNKLAPGVYGSVTIRLTALRQEVDRFTLEPEVLMTYIDGTSSSCSDAESGDSDSSGNGDSKSTLTTEIKTELENLVKGHIQFFENRAEIVVDGNTTSIKTNGGTALTDQNIDHYVHCDKYVFYNTNVTNVTNQQYLPLSSTNPLVGKLEWSSELGKNEGKPKEITLYWYWPYEYANLSEYIKSDIQNSDDLRNQYFESERMQEITNSSISWDETQLYDYGDTKLGTYVKSMKLHLKVEGYHYEEGQEQQ